MDISKEDLIENKDFNGLDLSNLSLNYKLFIGVTFRNCDFTSTKFDETTLEDCTFIDCNLSVSEFNQTKFHNTTFIGCKILSINFKRCCQFVVDFGFNNCLVQGCSFSDMKLNRLNFVKSTIVDCDFFDSSLVKSSFKGSDLSDSNFQNTNLSEANFQDAKNYIINPSANNIKKAIFSIPEAMSLLREFKIVIK